MKIVAQTYNGYMLEVSKSEIANLIGYYGEYDMKSSYAPKIGDEIKINDMYKQLYSLQNKQPELKKVVDTLRGLADLLEPTVPVIESVFVDCVKDEDYDK